MTQATIIDTDAHLPEPPDLWTSRLPKSWDKDRVMHVEWSDSEQSEVWTVGGQSLGRAWVNMSHNWEAQYHGEGIPELGPARFAEADPCQYDFKARVAEMDATGVRAQCLYPNIAGFWFDPFVNNPDEELSLAHLRVYNDYQIEWSESAPERVIPLATVPYWNVAETVKEIRRVASTHKGIVMTGAPQLHDQPVLGDRHWDPMWQALTETGLSVSFHVANVGVSEFYTPERIRSIGGRAANALSVPTFALINGQILADLLLSGVLARFPELNFVIVESGVGWVPFVLEASDYLFRTEEVWREQPEYGDMLPSDLFRRQVYVNYWYEKLEQFHVDKIGEDNIMFETDFPHNTGIWSQEVASAVRKLEALPKKVSDKVLWGNAARLYGLPALTPS